ncbi:MAG: ABC transporter ATP-binding protein [Lachnospiraceae bacterium]|jgi:ABC-2 type transport system ATP-binding protein|nr:ABC transporter ATP-binding protein [Lachnospiraceae bacterium]
MELKLSELTKRYGDNVALKDFSVTFTPGIYGLLGANGAGKSTMMNLITDNIRRDGGSITLDNRDILQMGNEFRAVLGYMPQQQGFYERMTAQGFVSYIARLKGMRGRQMHRQVEEILRLTNLFDVRNKAIRSFSGGMKQRVLLAQALLGDPKILLLDEPTAGLDPRERVRIRSFIKELARDRIVLLATHIVTDVESIAGQVILMKKGELLKMDTPQALMEAIPDSWTPVAYHLSLEDVYLYFLGE